MSAVSSATPVQTQPQGADSGANAGAEFWVQAMLLGGVIVVAVGLAMWAFMSLRR